MNINRLEKLLQAYGVHARNWPDQERAEALTFIEQNSLAAELLEQYQPLDHLLDSYQPTISLNLEEKILGQLPRSKIDGVINWLIPDIRAKLWHPALAASFTLMIGLLLSNTSIGQFLQPGSYNYSSQTKNTEIYLMALDETTDNQFILMVDKDE